MKKILSLFAMLLTLLGFGITLTISEARASLSLSPASSNYDVGMSFYKLIGREPDFSAWLKADPRYIQASPAEQPRLLASEVRKLQIKYGSLDVRKTPIVVRTVVQIRVATEKGGTKKFLQVEFPGQGTVYFPYLLSDQNITVIPNGIDLYRHIPLSDTEATALSTKIDYTGRATLVVEIVPQSADGRSPVMLDSIPQWLMLGEIGYIGFFNKYLEEIWSSQAPGYIRKDAEKIFNLHNSARQDGAGGSLESLKPDVTTAP